MNVSSKKVVEGLLLVAELDVFKSDFTYSGIPDYSLQVTQQSGIQALCLVTYKVNPEEPIPSYLICYAREPDLFDDWGQEDDWE